MKFLRNFKLTKDVSWILCTGHLLTGCLNLHLAYNTVKVMWAYITHFRTKTNYITNLMQTSISKIIKICNSHGIIMIDLYAKT